MLETCTVCFQPGHAACDCPGRAKHAIQQEAVASAAAEAAAAEAGVHDVRRELAAAAEDKRHADAAHQV